nr:hypothetical protein [Tanacetum cinerariifolium]
KRLHAPRAPVAPPPILSPPLALPSSPLSHPRDSVFKIGESSQTATSRQHTILTLMTHLERHEEQFDTILNHLDEFPLERIEQIEYGIEGLVDVRREQMRHDDEVVLARVKISNLEVLIEDIQVSMALLQPDFLEPLDIEPPIRSSIPSSLSLSVGSSLPIRSTTPPPDYPFDESIFAELDNSLWIIPRPLRSEPVLEEPNESDSC